MKVQIAAIFAVRAVSRPNVILLMADDLGWGDVGFNNHTYARPGTPWVFNAPRTPNLDAMAAADSSLVFWRFYAGSAVCSPTRSAAMTGRSPERECIDGPEPHGYGPAEQCFSPMPLSPLTTTVAELAAAAGYDTLHLGKWHLGNFFPKDDPAPTFAGKKWPTSNPSTHGFAEWHSTEASAPATTLNCGCDPAWAQQPPGCVTGGGVWSNRTFRCMNYWSPAETNASAAARCRACANATRDCVVPLASKELADDSAHIIDRLESFLDRRPAAGAPPFLAVLWLHAIHEPHPALPQFYHAYEDAFGDPAGDYLGTLTQTDAQVGRLRALLRSRGIANETLVWYTSDNGPHARDGIDAPRDANVGAGVDMAATNGLRQCKASLYEGGIRVPGILEWPGAIKRHAETWHPAYVSDYLPTFLDLINGSHPTPAWQADGMSLLPLVRALGAAGAANDTSRRPSEHPLVFKLGGQSALIDNEWKVLKNPSRGLCAAQNGTHKGGGTLLFNMGDDPTESHDLSQDAAHAAIFANMSTRLDTFLRSVSASRVNESQCASAGERAGGPPLRKIQPACNGPFPPPPSPQPTPPPPPPPPSPSFALQEPGGKCLAANSAVARAALSLAPCAPTDPLQRWQLEGGKIYLSGAAALCAKPQVGDECSSGMALWLGALCSGKHGFSGSGSNGTLPLAFACAPSLCLGHGTMPLLVACSDANSQGWAVVSSE